MSIFVQVTVDSYTDKTLYNVCISGSCILQGNCLVPCQILTIKNKPQDWFNIINSLLLRSETPCLPNICVRVLFITVISILVYCLLLSLFISHLSDKKGVILIHNIVCGVKTCHQF